MMTSITNTIASIKFYDRNFEDYQILHVTLSNLPDLEDQLYHLWAEVRGLLQDYHIDDHAAKLSSIDTFYSNLEYKELVKQISCYNCEISIFVVYIFIFDITECMFICTTLTR